MYVFIFDITNMNSWLGSILGSGVPVHHFRRKAIYAFINNFDYV